jgi:16S rRNA processing protein RimM
VNDLVPVGRAGRPHGLAGAFFVDDASDDPRRFAVGAELVVAGDALRVVESKRAQGRPVIRLERPVPRGARLEVPRAALPPAKEGEYYVFQLVGLAVEEQGGGQLGLVADVVPGIANDVLELDSGLALPMVEECIREIDFDRGRVVIAPGYSAPG